MSRDVGLTDQLQMSLSQTVIGLANHSDVMRFSVELVRLREASGLIRDSITQIASGEQTAIREGAKALEGQLFYEGEWSYSAMQATVLLGQLSLGDFVGSALMNMSVPTGDQPDRPLGLLEGLECSLAALTPGCETANLADAAVDFAELAEACDVIAESVSRVASCQPDDVARGIKALMSALVLERGWVYHALQVARFIDHVRRAVES